MRCINGPDPLLGVQRCDQQAPTLPFLDIIKVRAQLSLVSQVCVTDGLKLVASEPPNTHALSLSLRLNRPDCETPVIADRSDASFPKLLCPSCEFEYCFECGRGVRTTYLSTRARTHTHTYAVLADWFCCCWIVVARWYLMRARNQASSRSSKPEQKVCTIVSAQD
jgi:hypothetical protein